VYPLELESTLSQIGSIKVREVYLRQLMPSPSEKRRITVGNWAIGGEDKVFTEL
jgi:hypothetical protein